MRRIIIIYILLLSTQLIGQTSFETKNKYECFWNERSKTYNDCMAFSDSSQFVFDLDNHQIKRSGDGKESWFIRERKKIEKGVEVFMLLDDQMQECFLVIDTIRGEIKISSGKKQEYLINYNIINFKTE